MIVEANGINYFVKIHQVNNAKPDLILLHGFMGTGEVFTKLSNHLKPFCNPVTIDLLGHGKSGKASKPNRFSSQNQVADLKEIISKISSSRSFLYGYSMGGRLALQFAVANSKMLNGLILESTNPGLSSKKERMDRIRLDEEHARAIENDFGAFLENWKQLPLFNDAKALNAYHKIQLQNEPKQMAMSLRGFGAGTMPFVNIKKVDLPTLLLAGLNDDKYVKISKTLSRQTTNSILQIIPDAGHRIHIEQPHRTSSCIQDFI